MKIMVSRNSTVKLSVLNNAITNEEQNKFFELRSSAAVLLITADG